MSDHASSTAWQPEKQPYAQRIEDAYDKHILPRAKPGIFVEVHVTHDDHCPLLANQGYCTCEPAITACWVDAKGRSRQVELP